MSLPKGARLGPYEIVSPVGSGGMGEVYKARDTRLDRSVAVKILPFDPNASIASRERFEREARAISQLSHPHVCSLFDIGNAGGMPYLVMELLEGETLADRLKSGALPLDEVLRHGIEICGALGHAHGLGIVHRDLKPANIMLTKQRVKLLDFGLAQAFRPAETTSQEPLATRPSPLTTEGTMVGTPQYMAPEQIEGKAVDVRADLFAFGLVLYEMTTGQPAFSADSVPALISSIMRDTPPPASQSRPEAPRTLDRVIEACLVKKPEDRVRSAHDVALQLRWIADDLGLSPPREPRPEALRLRRRRSLALIALAALLAGIAGAWWWMEKSVPAESTWSKYTQLTDASGMETGPSLSPDGALFAYASALRGTFDIYVQRVGGRTPVLAASDPGRDEVWPAFSPDGTQIAFSLGGALGISVVGATGESPRRVTAFGSNPAWSPDGKRIVFCTEELKNGYERIGHSDLWTVDLNDGVSRKLDAGDAIQPAWSPKGARIAFWQSVGGQRDVVTIPAAGGPHVLLTDDAAVDWAPAWSPDGRFIYFASDRGGSMGIWRIAVDESSGVPRGAPEPIALGADLAMDLPHLSADGRSLVFRSAIESINPAAIDFDPVTGRAGAVRLLQHRTGKLVPTDASPDGKWIALSNRSDLQQDIFIMRSDGSELTRLTDDVARDTIPRFTPDSGAVIFQSNKDGAWDAWSIRVDGSNRTRLTAMGDAYGPSMAPDGRLMVTAGPDGTDILIGAPPWPMTRRTATLVKPPEIAGGTFSAAFWSRDGRWLSGGITPAQGGVRGNALFDAVKGVVRHLSDDANGYEMAWMPGGRSVLYFTANGALMFQDLTSLARHQVAVALPYPPDSYHSLTASPDGRTLYYGAQQLEGNIWKVEQPKPR